MFFGSPRLAASRTLKKLYKKLFEYFSNSLISKNPESVTSVDPKIIEPILRVYIPKLKPKRNLAEI